MPDIMRLKDVANSTLDQAFLASDQPSALEPVVAAGDIEPTAVEFDIQQFDAVLAHTVKFRSVRYRYGCRHGR